jgi:hypothetical protein
MPYDLAPPLAVVLPAYAVTLIGLAISLALSAASYFLFRPGKPKTPTGRAQPTLAERGSFVPRLLGTQKIAPLVAWLNTSPTGSSQGSTTRGPVATQQGWHILCVGPAAALHRIWEGGKLIFPKKDTTETTLTPDTHPSGTKITLKSGKGAFYIYWGEPDQPVNSILAAQSGINSRWPYLCYILWDRKQLQIMNSWPTLEYELTVKTLQDDYLSDSPAWMEGDGNNTNDGINPAHALYELMTEPYPHGVGMPVENINLEKMEELGVLLDEEGIPVNLRTMDGKEASETIGNIMADCSLMMTQTGDLLTVLPVRSPMEAEVWPVLPASSLCPPSIEKAVSIGPRYRASAVQYTFSDRSIKFKDNVISFRDDAESLQQGAPKIQNTVLETVISRKIANRVCDRRSVEDLTSPIAVKIQTVRASRYLNAGQRLELPDGRVIRIFSIERRSDSPLCTVEGMEDIYSPANAAYPDDDTPASSVDYSPEPDIVFELIELPYALCLNKQITTMLLRERANPAIDGAQVYMTNLASVTGTEPSPKLFDFAFEYKHTYGDLAEDLSDALALSETGPLVHILSSNVDMGDIQDLTGDDNEEDWRKGTNVAIIGDEWCFFKQLVHTSGNYYRLDGIIRGRWTTDRVSHTTGARVWIFPVDEINQLNKNIFGATKRVAYWSIPFISDRLVEFDDVENELLNGILGVSMRPLSPVNFRSDDGQWIRWNTWASGAAVTFMWSNRSRSANGFTAGTQLAGEVHSADAVYMDGDLQIKIVRISDDSVRRTFKVSAGTSKQYTNAQLVSDFGGSEPASFEVQYYQQLGTYKSPVKTITVTRR